MLLDKLDAPRTPENYDFLAAWAERENTRAENNPLATTQDAPGSSSFNAAGVKNYDTPGVGAAATYRTLTNGYYGDILAALRSGNPSTEKNYRGLHTWSAGPGGPPGQGYWNLHGFGPQREQPSRHELQA